MTDPLDEPLHTDLRPHCHLRPTGERAATWLQIFGRTENIPLASWIPTIGYLPGQQGPQQVYILDFTRITPEERTRFIDAVAEATGTHRDTVAADLERLSGYISEKDAIVPIPLYLLDD